MYTLFGFLVCFISETIFCKIFVPDYNIYVEHTLTWGTVGRSPPWSLKSLSSSNYVSRFDTIAILVDTFSILVDTILLLFSLKPNTEHALLAIIVKHPSVFFLFKMKLKFCQLFEGWFLLSFRRTLSPDFHRISLHRITIRRGRTARTYQTGADFMNQFRT
jgi:hypothetical protein